MTFTPPVFLSHGAPKDTSRAFKGCGEGSNHHT